MRSVCTITCHNVINHGAMLQEWALMRFLRDSGYDASIINYQPSLAPQLKHRRVPEKYDYPVIEWLYILLKAQEHIILKKRCQAFALFYDKYIRPFTTDRLYTTIDQLRGNPPKADTYVAGSDQIWNTEFSNGNDPAFYLDFGPESTRRLSYAASFATEHICPQSTAFVERELHNFDSISVRESSGIHILNELGFSGVQVCDPVFLLSKEDFKPMAESVKLPDKDYIVVCDFEKSADVKAVATRLARAKGYKIASVGPFNLNYADYDYTLNAPDAFVWLIQNAKCVISNSFHACAFALIFNIDLFFVNRKDGLNLRISDLLSHYGISERIISGTVSDDLLCGNIDYTILNQMLDHDISFSRAWLLSNL